VVGQISDTTNPDPEIGRRPSFVTLTPDSRINHIRLFDHIYSTVAVYAHMAGLGTDDQKNAIAATAPIATAFKFCIRHRKSGLLNRLPIEVRFWCF
jgi:hypothetical protein